MEVQRGGEGVLVFGHQKAIWISFTINLYLWKEGDPYGKKA